MQSLNQQNPVSGNCILWSCGAELTVGDASGCHKALHSCCRIWVKALEFASSSCQQTRPAACRDLRSRGPRAHCNSLPALRQLHVTSPSLFFLGGGGAMGHGLSFASRPVWAAQSEALRAQTTTTSSQEQRLLECANTHRHYRSQRFSMDTHHRQALGP